MKHKEYFAVTDSAINGFFEDYFFLSNFYEAPVWFEGIYYPSTENAYQAAKSVDLEIRRFHFVNCSPAISKKNGKQIVIRKDWEEIKYSVMLRIVTEKFASTPELAEKLLATGDRILTETNHWGDKIWGVDYKTLEGTNWLGKILMHVRSSLRER